MKRALVLIAFAALSQACVTRPSLRIDWLPQEALAHDPKQYPDAAAVALHRSDHVLLAMRESESSFTHLGEHVAWYIQKEGAFDLAEVKIPHRAKDKLVGLKARIIAPDGRVRELDAAQMLTDADGKGERDINAQFFRFPGVEVGSILEYWYVIENEHLYFGRDQGTVGRYPVKRYQFDVTASKPIRLEIKEYNATFPINKETLADGSQRFSCEITQIPGQEVEKFSPHWTFTQPRWAFRLVKFVLNYGTYPGQNTWESVLRSDARSAMIKGTYFDGFTETLDTQGCADVACKVNRALKFVRERTRFVNGARSSRPLKEILETREATAEERTILAARLLNDAEVNTRIAWLTRVWSEQIDTSFPLDTRFNYQLLQVRPQGELKEALWVDASRDDLEPGQLDPEHLNTHAFTIRAFDRGPIDPFYEADWAVTAGKAGPPMVWRQRQEARLEANGDLKTTVVDEHAGSIARTRESDERFLTDREFQDKAREIVLNISPLTRLSAPASRSCAADKSVCSRAFPTVTPSYAFHENGRYSVPLKLFWPMWPELFLEDERTADIYFVGESRNEEVINLEVPKGYSLSSKPLRLSHKVGGLDAEITIEATATGAKVTRALARHQGAWPKASYGEMQKVLRLYQDARRQVLSFEKVTAAAPR